MYNTKVKEFTTSLGNLLNQGIADLGISTVVLVLDKYLGDSIKLEQEVLQNEFDEEQARLKAIADEKMGIENDLIEEAEKYEAEIDTTPHEFEGEDIDLKK